MLTIYSEAVTCAELATPYFEKKGNECGCVPNILSHLWRFSDVTVNSKVYEWH